MADSARGERRVPLVARLAIVLLGAAVIWGAIVAIGLAGDDAERPIGTRVLTAAIAGVGGVSLVVLVRRYVDRRPFSGLLLPLSRRAWVPLTVGISAFMVPALAGLAVGVATGAITISLRVSTPEAIGIILLLVVSVFVLEALPEELIFRGYVYRNLITAVAPLIAVLLQATLFAIFGTAIWVVGSGWQVIDERFWIFLGVGIVTGLIRLVAGSVWASIGFHWAFQVVAQSLLGTAATVQGPYALFVMLPAFVLGTSIVSLLLRRPENWLRPEPDPLSLSHD